MRRPRLTIDDGFYHVISRVVDRRFILNDDEKERFRKLMRAVEAFSGVQILSYSILTNHFHMLPHVPVWRPISDEELINRLAHLYHPVEVADIAHRLNRHREVGDEKSAERLKSSFTYRMYNLAEFMKTLKQRYTQSYNRRHGRKGTLWEERYKSTLIEGKAHALATTAAYIELNAVRAGLVKDPKDYRFCSYGEALGGSRRARKAICRILASLGRGTSWRRVRQEYREYLYECGRDRGLGEDGRPLKPGFSEEKVAAVLAAGGKLSRSELLRCRVRYFTDGAVLGSRAFVKDIFCRYRGHFGLKRQTGARAMVGGDWEGLCTIRKLRMAVIALPGG